MRSAWTVWQGLQSMDRCRGASITNIFKPGLRRLASSAGWRSPISSPPVLTSQQARKERDQRLLYLVSTVLNVRLVQSQVFYWLRLRADFSSFLQIAAKVDFAAYAMIVISANHLASITKSVVMLEDALYYQSLAFKGLRNALNSFSKNNSDSVLAASILLLFQQKNW